ncbi:MAG: CAAX prenyl protease-related protein [Pirellulales bacterium]|nr:CAAX prenyl protease-related protein [Pirellulales bacterium]
MALFRNPWVVFLLPFIIYMVGTSSEPSAVMEATAAPHWTGLTAAHYPYVYAAKIVLTLACVAAVWGGYPTLGKISPLAWGVGVVGVVLWIALAHLQRVSGLNGVLAAVGMGGERPAFNPWEHYGDQPALLYCFLAVRFLGLAAVVPVIEEMFLRGFVMRYPIREDWWDVPWGTYAPSALAAGTILPMLLHPGEILAAAAWFGLVHWLYFRTRNVWDAVVAHGVTNLLLGIYVCAQGEWWLW